MEEKYDLSGLLNKIRNDTPNETTTLQLLTSMGQSSTSIMRTGLFDEYTGIQFDFHIIHNIYSFVVPLSSVPFSPTTIEASNQPDDIVVEEKKTITSNLILDLLPFRTVIQLPEYTFPKKTSQENINKTSSIPTSNTSNNSSFEVNHQIISNQNLVETSLPKRSQSLPNCEFIDKKNNSLQSHKSPLSSAIQNYSIFNKSSSNISTSVISNNMTSDENEIDTNNNIDDDTSRGKSSFLTARQQYDKDQKKKYGNNYKGGNLGSSNNNKGTTTKRGGTLGVKRRFNSPQTMDDENISIAKRILNHNNNPGNSTKKEADTIEDQEDMPEEYRNIDPAMIERIENEIVYTGTPVTWDDIAGLSYAKRCIMEMVVWPMQRPDIFTGLREVPRGLLLFGPPGTGKTLLGKAIAYICKYTFFSISSSTLTSKWIGEGEKMVRALFAVASVRGPSVIFIDEIDSLLTLRSEGENEGTRRLKTEFLVQLDGITSKGRILVIGATNRPQDLDEAARRRFVKRLYIPLPDTEARGQLFVSLLKQNKCSINLEDKNEGSELYQLINMSKGYSCADIYNLCREAALGPLRDITAGINGDLLHMNVDDMRGICFSDFISAFKQIRSSVGVGELKAYIEWNNIYGSTRIEEEVLDINSEDKKE
ncbi:hypothetical protein WA158_001408 [Blastocystis sp. Blastoise]